MMELNNTIYMTGNVLRMEEICGQFSQFPPNTLLDYVEGRISLKKLYEITPWDNITIYFQGGIQKDEYKPVTEYMGYLMKHVTKSYFTFDYVLDEDARKIRDWIRIQKNKR